ncbi:MAG: hypothetical protein OXG94_11515 [Bacteroidetes bacterium]|nr:hypothetical protein [Bacteroidota bacterium]
MATINHGRFLGICPTSKLSLDKAIVLGGVLCWRILVWRGAVKMPRTALQLQRFSGKHPGARAGILDALSAL